LAGREKWSSLGLEDFERMKKKFGVGWVILERAGVVGMPCPYVNRAVMVCRIP